MQSVQLLSIYDFPNYLFVFYLRLLSVAHIITRRMVGWLGNNEFGQEMVMTEFRYSAGMCLKGLSKTTKSLNSVLLVPWLRIEARTSQIQTWSVVALTNSFGTHVFCIPVLFDQEIYIFLLRENRLAPSQGKIAKFFPGKYHIIF
jgi:hypothetical protein